MQLNGARILLTGASGGLGQALAKTLAQEGASLLLVGRDQKKLAALAVDLAGGGRAITTLAVDLNQPADVARLVEEAARFRADVLINNAGINAFGLFEQQDWTRVADVLETNLAAPMRLTHALLPQLQSRERAAIVNIGSTFGSLPFPGFAAYSAAKAGMKGFSQALRRELADSRVEVIYVAPRAIDTPLNTPAVVALNEKLGSQSDSPQVAARQIVAALAAGRGETYLGFPERLFAWLNGCAPTLIDRALKPKLAIVKRHARPSL
ncbi:MAG: SDR family oxidoreductase [Gammaproteobacteria bacterium]|nr:SDR family oxidoreductase [Gammaproteobacteria bacterium]